MKQLDPPIIPSVLLPVSHAGRSVNMLWMHGEKTSKCFKRMSSDKNIQWSLDVFHQHHTIVSIHYLIPYLKKNKNVQNVQTKLTNPNCQGFSNFQDLQRF